MYEGMETPGPVIIARVSTWNGSGFIHRWGRGQNQREARRGLAVCGPLSSDA